MGFRVCFIIPQLLREECILCYNLKKFFLFSAKNQSGVSGSEKTVPSSAFSACMQIQGRKRGMPVFSLSVSFSAADIHADFPEKIRDPAEAAEWTRPHVCSQNTSKGGGIMPAYSHFSGFEPSLGKQNPWSFLEESQPIKLYGPNQLLYLQQETAEQFYYLKSGRVRIFLSSPSGEEKTLSIAEAGSLLGEAAFFDGNPRVSSARTLVKSQIITITREILLRCFREKPERALELCRYLSSTIRMLSAQVDSMAFQQADQRLAELLLRLQRCGRIAATHEELGALAGVSRVTVSRIISRFAKWGWIETGYGTIILRKPEKLSLLSHGEAPPSFQSPD